MDRDKIKSIANNWGRIEGRLKESELISRNACIPAINELRYAGRQIADALDIYFSTEIQEEEKSDKLDKKLVIADQYLKNADHDITDAILSFVDERINTMYTNYGRLHVLRAYPDADAVKDKLSYCYNRILETRKDRSKRGEIYRQIEVEYLPDIIEKYKNFKLIEENFIYNDLKTGQVLKYVRSLARFVEFAIVFLLVLSVSYSFRDNISDIIRNL